MGAIVTAKQVNVEVLTDVHRAMSDRRAVWGIPYPWQSLNKLTGGMHPEQMVVLGGRPGDGKTSVMCQMVLTVAEWMKAEKVEGCIRVVTSEMSPKMLQHRMASMLSGLPHFRIQSGRLDIAEYALLEEALVALDEMPIEYLEPASITDAKDFLIQPENPTVFWAMDYMQLHPFKDGNYSAYDRVTKVSQAYRWFSRHVSPGVALSQLSRPDKAKPHEKPMLSSFRDSGSIEQDASVVLALHRVFAQSTDEEQMEREEQELIPVKLLVLKNRSGPAPRSLGCTFVSDRMLLFENALKVVSA